MAGGVSPEPPKTGYAAWRARQESQQQPQYRAPAVRVRLSRRGASVHDGLAITAFIVAWLVPFIGFILGWVSVTSAHKVNHRASGLAVAAVALGALAVIVWVIAISVLLGAP